MCVIIECNNNIINDAGTSQLVVPCDLYTGKAILPYLHQFLSNDIEYHTVYRHHIERIEEEVPSFKEKAEPKNYIVYRQTPFTKNRLVSFVPLVEFKVKENLYRAIDYLVGDNSAPVAIPKFSSKAWTWEDIKELVEVEFGILNKTSSRIYLYNYDSNQVRVDLAVKEGMYITSEGEIDYDILD